METIVNCIVCGSPVVSFYAKIEADEVEKIILSCANGHERSIQAYLEKGALSEKNAGILSRQAQEGIELIHEARNRPIRASDLVSDPEVEKQGWPCVRCNDPAQSAPGSPLKQQRALCLPCRADWMTWGLTQHDDIFGPLRKTHGRPGDLFWGIQFQRFLNNTDSVAGDAAERLLEDCRRQAKGHHKSSDTEFIRKTAEDLRHTA